jgi:large subunit ribosomal protein L3
MAAELEVEHAPAGFVDDAAVHEIPALPSDEEVKAIAAEQEAGAIEAEAAAQAEAEGTETNSSDAAEGETPAADESKEG